MTKQQKTTAAEIMSKNPAGKWFAFRGPRRRPYLCNQGGIGEVYDLSDGRRIDPGVGFSLIFSYGVLTFNAINL